MAQQRAGNISAGELDKFIGDVTFPADKDDLINHVQGKGAPKKILDLMKKVPPRRYESIADLSLGMSQSRH